MFIEPKELEVLAGSGGEQFEKFVRSLIQAECALHGISPTDIDWDYRTNCPDAGIDISIKEGHEDARPRFIPNKPSIWSIKSGANGIEASTLRGEVTKHSHERIREHLRKGNTYVWCALQAISQPKREAMYTECKALAKKHKFAAEQVKFVWVDQLQQIVEMHPNIIASYFPDVAQRLQGLMTIDQWQRESRDAQGFAVRWVDFAGRNELKTRIQEHLKGSEGSAVFHLAGLSGVGKTRTVLQACLDDKVLEDTYYAPRYEDLSEDFLSHVERQDINVRLIIDEVQLTDYDPLRYRFRDIGKRVRIVTVGPATRGQSRRSSESSLYVLEEPDTDEGVLQVVGRAGSDLHDDVLRSIAEVSGHDLRLALLLVFATRRNAKMRTVPVCDLDDVWKRVTSLFASRLGSVSQFSESYEILTSAIDIGHSGKYRNEVEYIGKHFSIPATGLDGAISAAHDCGLGIRTDRFFEAEPRALAVWLFQERLWPKLASTLESFLARMPSERLRRRFIERCCEVRGPERDRILDCVGVFFFNYLGAPNITRLVDRERSRVFQAWSELDPRRGLSWLRNATEAATDDDIRCLDGAPDGSGGWRGRRQVVWLCEHLACFGEYFWDCESILFRLAQVETEQSISNNSTNTWRAMFLPILSNTEVSFPDRLEHLLRRLQEASRGTINLVLSAAFGVLETHIVRMQGPSVVGGRIVPDEWRPRTQAELRALQANAGRAILQCIEKLESHQRRTAIEGVIAKLSRFVYAGLVGELREVMMWAAKDAGLLRKFRIAVDEVISGAEMRKENGRPEPEFLGELKRWRAETKPGSILEQVVDLTARDYWTVRRRFLKEERTEQAEEVYRQVAECLIKQPQLMEDLGSWFDSEECRSGRILAWQLGQVDQALVIMPTVVRWVERGRPADFIVHYLGAVANRLGELPQEATDALNRAVGGHPMLVGEATMAGPCSITAFERLMNCIDKLTAEERRIFGSLAYGSWQKLLSSKQKLELVSRLEEFARVGDSGSLRVAFDLLVGWSEHGKRILEEQLAAAAIRLLSLAGEPQNVVDDWDWKIVAELLMPIYPSEVAHILADTITDMESHRFDRSKYAQELFKKLADSQPGEAMKAIGRWILDERRGPLFQLLVFRGLFDTIGLDTVRPWVEQQGEIAAVRIARHLDGPALNENGEPVIPELADWLLTRFAHSRRVFREFCMGRHSFEIRGGHARERREGIERLTKPFVHDHRKWVRDWAKYEMDWLQEETSRDDLEEDEFERT